MIETLMLWSALVFSISGAMVLVLAAAELFR